MSSFVPAREIGLVGLAAAAAYTLLAIVSYSPMDPSFSFSGDGGDVHNLVGSSGAWFAGLMLYLFGIMVYCLPVALLVVGVNLFRDRVADSSWLLFSVRILGWVGLFVSGCVLAQLHIVTGIPLPAGTGGIVGQWLIRAGMPIFGWVGLTLLCLTGALIGVQAAAGFSWLTVAETTGRWLHRFSAAVVSFADRQADKWRMTRRKQSQASQQRERE